jgi:YfiR/HmsC-like
MNSFLLSLLLLALTTVAGWSCPATLHAESTSANGEYQIKAAMIYNILSYVEWPVELLLAENSPLTICIAGSGAMDSVIPALNGQHQKGHPLIAREITTADDAKKCQVLIINTSERLQLPAIFEKTQQLSLLTISDLNGFSEAGGIVELAKDGTKIRLEINLSAARQHRIKISSQLLKLARIVRGEK